MHLQWPLSCLCTCSGPSFALCLCTCTSVPVQPWASRWRAKNGIPSLQDGGSFDDNKMSEVNTDLLWKVLSRVFDPDRGPPERWTVINKGDPNKFCIVFHWFLDRAGKSPLSVGYVASNNDGVTTLSWIEDFWDPTVQYLKLSPPLLWRHSQRGNI